MIDERQCWYCGGEAALWCDHMIGRTYEPEQIPILLPEDDRIRGVLNNPGMTGAELGRLHMDLRTLQPIATCDAAACLCCAERHGWQRVGHMCGDGGCETLDNCHAHAGRGIGTSLYVPRGAAEVARAEVRAQCRRMQFVIVS